MGRRQERPNPLGASLPDSPSVGASLFSRIGSEVSPVGPPGWEYEKMDRPAAADPMSEGIEGVRGQGEGLMGEYPPRGCTCPGRSRRSYTTAFDWAAMNGSLGAVVLADQHFLQVDRTVSLITEDCLNLIVIALGVVLLASAARRAGLRISWRAGLDEHGEVVALAE